MDLKAVYEEAVRRKKRIWVSNYRRRMRRLVVNVLGGRCVKCGESKIGNLQIHHKNFGGNEERKRFSDETTYYKYIIQKVKDGCKDYVLLCRDCHFLRGEDGKVKHLVEVHKRSVVRERDSLQRALNDLTRKIYGDVPPKGLSMEELGEWYKKRLKSS